MSTKINWIITDHNITVNWQDASGKWQTHIVSRSIALADQLIQAMKENRLDEIPNLVSVAKRIENQSHGKFVVQDGQILIDGVPAPTVLGNKILRFSNDGLPYEPLVKFAANLQRNPSYRAVNELFQFLEKNDHPITENGNFIAYKRVRGDLTDIRTGTFDNTPGNVVQMERNQVNEDSSQTCSAGLHVANWNYAHTQFASHDPETDIMLLVEVNPADVVSIPVDYNQSKMRVSKYKVLGAVNEELSSDTSLRVTGSSEGWAGEEVDEEEEEYTCGSCGAPLETNDDLCCDCESVREDEETDVYPWEDEIN